MDTPEFTKVRAVALEALAGTFDVFDKLDGHHLLIRRGEAYRRSRARNEWDRLPASIRDRIGDDWLDGELLVPGQPADSVNTALGSIGGALVFRPFHIPGFTGNAAAEHTELVRRSWEPPAYMGRFTAAQIRRRWPATWSHTVAEGIVLRPVVPDGQPPAGPWLKLKRVETVDLVIIAVLPGRGRNAGRVGALVCRLDGGRTVRVGVLAHDVGQGLGEHTIGQLAEVAYQSRTARGSLRHPRLLRIRHDRRRHAV